MKRIIAFLIGAAVIGSAVMIGVHDYLPKVVRRSVAVPGASRSTENPESVCGQFLSHISALTPNHTCVLSAARRAASETDEENLCVDGPGVEGCFACTFECRWDLPSPLVRVMQFWQ